MLWSFLDYLSVCCLDCYRLDKHFMISSCYILKQPLLIVPAYHISHNIYRIQCQWGDFKSPSEFDMPHLVACLIDYVLDPLKGIYSNSQNLWEAKIEKNTQRTITQQKDLHGSPLGLCPWSCSNFHHVRENNTETVCNTSNPNSEVTIYRTPKRGKKNSYWHKPHKKTYLKS